MTDNKQEKYTSPVMDSRLSDEHRSALKKGAAWLRTWLTKRLNYKNSENQSVLSEDEYKKAMLSMDKTHIYPISLGKDELGRILKDETIYRTNELLPDQKKKMMVEKESGWLNGEELSDGKALGRAMEKLMIKQYNP